ncbi:Dipeptide transport system permease protein DppB [Pseudovibrio axinellae]|uniref:Dipeptide transport system permease protein DppB n=1 Tax=Pseudovibrio axinellae TaxID=989403 RepID=A0A165SYW0_9HYPH|nr:ABC transporter permease [Pseudovibrio axinellae]KZL05041.1 Dipeptide transport system permease protein DppB [Pseudovibrio axinellae]SER65702.1 peptide/nickel transport system permease protein [Pseudovibrio axinellae]
MIIRSFLARFFSTLVTLFGVAVVVFVLVRIAPGNPIAMMLPPGATEEDVARLRALYGFDKTLIEQFFVWLGNVIYGDFGTSITMRLPVSELVLQRLPATLELSIMALVIALVLGGSLAVFGARFRGRAQEVGVDISTGAALSVPDFLWGLLLILAFGVAWPVLHISGRVDPHMDVDLTTNFYFFEGLLLGDFALVSSVLSHMLMPALALGLPLAAMIAQLLKQSLKEQLDQDYVNLARVRGHGETHVILSEALRNAALPTLTLIGVQFAFLIGGTVIVERLFAYEGLGNMAIDAVINRDLPLIQGIVLLFAVLFIAINLTVDLTYSLLNPKLRHD